MNQNLEFRAWTGTKMINDIRLVSAHGIRLVSSEDLAPHDMSDDKVVIMQYTGFNDAQTNKIFDGTILLYEKLIRLRGDKTKIENHYWEVSMSPLGQWVAKRGDVIARLSHILQSPHFVAGNIYENKDLIK